MDVLGRRNGAEKGKWTSGESQVNSIHNDGFIISSRNAHSASPCRTGPRSAVVNVSGYNCESDCRSRGREFDPGPVPYFSTVILLPSVLPLNYS